MRQLRLPAEGDSRGDRFPDRTGNIPQVKLPKLFRGLPNMRVTINDHR